MVREFRRSKVYSCLLDRCKSFSVNKNLNRAVPAVSTSKAVYKKKFADLCLVFAWTVTYVLGDDIPVLGVVWLNNPGL